MRKPHGRIHRSFTPNGALPLQTISPHAAGAVARSHARLSDDSHRPGRSRRANAGRGDGPRAAHSIESCTGIGSTTAHAVWTLLVGNSATAILGNPSSFKRRSEEHTSELQSRLHLVCRLL